MCIRDSSPTVLSKSRKQRFLAPSPRQGHTRTLQPLSSPPRLLCRSPGPVPSVSGLRCPKPHLSRVFKLTPARNTLHTALARTLRAHRHRRHALPLHTRSSTTPPKHSPAQSGQGPPLGDPGRPWLATALGSSAAVSGSPTTARRRQALTPVGWTCCGHGRCTRAAWCRPQLRCRPAWSWRPTSGVVSGRRLNESVEQRVTSVPLESLLGRNPGAGPRNTPRSRLSRIAGHSRAARSELAATLKKASIAGGVQKSLPMVSMSNFAVMVVPTKST